MDMVMTYLILLLASLPVIFLLRTLLGCRGGRTLNHPPGPKPWPLIGNLHLLGRLPHRSLTTLSAQYGPLMQLRLGSRPAIIVSSIKIAKEILFTHDLTFADRPLTAGGRHIAYGNSNVALSSYGPYWRQGRRIYMTEVLNPKKLFSLESVSIREEEVRTLMDELFRVSGKRVTVREYISRAALNIISRMALGKTYTDGPTFTKDYLRSILDELFHLLGVFNLGDYMPWLAFLDVQGYERRMKRAAKKMDQFLEHVLDDHEDRRRREGEGFVAGNDLVDALLRVADDPSTEVKLTRDNVKALTEDLLSGGTDTALATVEWALSELLINKEALAKATEELERVIGKGRWVEEKDIAGSDLPYLELVVKETMRLHPVVPLLVPRVAREDCTINGYHVGVGTIVLVNTWTMGRDPKVWEAPDLFRPERFAGTEMDVAGKSFELLPFGGGRRMCPGYNQGMRVVKLTLASLLQGFEWKLPEEVTELSMEESFGLTLIKKERLETVFTPRLPSHMYL